MSGDHIELSGLVVDVQRGKFKVDVGNNNLILARLSGRMNQNKIQVVLGDKVVIKVSPYDLTNGIIIQRT